MKHKMMAAALLATVHCSLTTASAQIFPPAPEAPWSGIRALGNIIPGDAAVFTDETGRFVRSASLPEFGTAPAWVTTGELARAVSGLATTGQVAVAQGIAEGAATQAGTASAGLAAHVGAQAIHLTPAQAALIASVPGVSEVADGAHAVAVQANALARNADLHATAVDGALQQHKLDFGKLLCHALAARHATAQQLVDDHICGLGRDLKDVRSAHRRHLQQRQNHRHRQ